MKKSLSILAAVLLFVVVSNCYATPSTEVWTAASSDIQPYGVLHIGVDNYFTAGRKNEKGSLPTDVGLTIGVLPYERLQLEVGLDYLEPTTDPILLNAKLGVPEGTLYEGSPAFNLGLFNVGTDTKTDDGDGRTDLNIVDFIIGKTLPFDLGRVHIGVYRGNAKVLVDKDGNKENSGYMIGWDKGFAPEKDGDAEYNKWVVAADWASGKNAIGGGGAAVSYYFTKDISVLTGPVWFNEPELAGPSANAKWVWSTQLDINY